MFGNKIASLGNQAYSRDLRQIVVNTCMLLYTVALIASNLFIGKFYSSELHWLGFISGLMLWVMFILKFIQSSANERKQWCRDNALVILFFIISFFNLVGNYLAYSVIRVYFVESIYLVLFTSYFCDKTFIKRVIFRMFIWINFLMNIAPIIINILMAYQLNNTNLIESLFYYTYMDSEHVTPYSILYSNPNSLGIMTTTAVLLAIIGYRRKQKLWVKILFLLYLAFSINILIVSESRASIVSLVGALIIYLVIRVIRYRSNYVVAVTLLIVVIGNLGMVGFMAFQQNTGIDKFNNTELMLNTKSSDRYVIWKSTYLSFSTKDLIFGSGSLSFIEDSRYNYLKIHAPSVFSYKDEKVDLRKKYEESLDSGLDRWTSALYHSGFSGVDTIYQLLLDKDKYISQEADYPSKKRNVVLAETTQNANDVAAKRLEAMRSIDTHNGYYSTMFCNGIVGLLIIISILLQRIMRMDNKAVAYWALPVLYIVLLNCFESALVVDRYTPVVILFMLFAIGDVRRNKVGTAV